MTKLPQRILAVDALRGIAIAAMVLVNNPGSWSHVYAPMRHAQWHGWTLADLVFPFFIFIMGVSAALSLPKQVASGKSAIQVINQAAIRAGKLFSLGLLLALFYYNFHVVDYSWWHQQVVELRVFGVLQRLGLVFFITAVCVVWLSARMIAVMFLLLLVLYWGLMALMPYSDASGNVYQGLWNFGNSFAAWVDANLLGVSHVFYRSATPFAFDPEGILSTLPAVASGLLGVLAGKGIQQPATWLVKLNWLIVAGAVLTASGLLLEQVVPVNKALWTPSYVLLTGGLALFSLSALIWLLDVKQLICWAQPLIICGSNSIAFYLIAGVLARLLIIIPVGNSSLHGWIYNKGLVPIFGELNGSLAFAVIFFIVSFIPIWLMYRKNFFWKV
ncbi:DUF5009 domain-containing protein [Alteromonas pelagimontana]|uniref:DUF5009 domain-containing protein n=1 Tax=Alteromonas pelagimontana TaxID=1858656 RepID=A0A6M4MBS8_9ALTE|nr:DUF5009 domain-containing protein [Alteromonas pelagimontana]QJR80479.1 DUF5009 domain-containing protein [Alteromonas pelagimontana]